jgi:hypothetical protein
MHCHVCCSAAHIPMLSVLIMTHIMLLSLHAGFASADAMHMHQTTGKASFLAVWSSQRTLYCWAASWLLPAKRHMRHTYSAPGGGCQRASYAGTALPDTSVVSLALLSCAATAAVWRLPRKCACIEVGLQRSLSCYTNAVDVPVLDHPVCASSKGMYTAPGGRPCWCSAHCRVRRPSCCKVAHQALLHAAHLMMASVPPMELLWLLARADPLNGMLPQSPLQKLPPGTAPTGRMLPAMCRGQKSLSWQVRQLQQDTLPLRGLQPEVLSQMTLLKLAVRLLQCEL